MMKRTGKQISALFLAAVMAVSAASTVQAADDRERIDKVTLNFAYDKEPASGDEIGDIRVTTNSDHGSLTVA